MSKLIHFPSDVFFSFNVSFRIWPWIPHFFSGFGKNLLDFSSFSYHWHLLPIRIPSAISSKVSSNSYVCLLYSFMFPSLSSFVSRTFILFFKLGIFCFIITIIVFFFWNGLEKATQNLRTHVLKNPTLSVHRGHFLWIEF